MDDTTWDLVETERRTLAELLDGLTPDQWAAPSLCTEWRVRDVAAHLAMTPARAPSIGTMFRALVANRGRLWSAGRDVAIAYAAMPTQQIVRELRDQAGSRARPVFVQDDNILLDLVVHGQDIAVPLGVDRPVPPAAGELVLRRVWSMGWPFHARRRLDGFSVRADDCDWSAGSGPAVEASAAQLLLVMTERSAQLEALRGPGAAALRRRLSDDRRVTRS